MLSQTNFDIIHLAYKLICCKLTPMLSFEKIHDNIFEHCTKSCSLSSHFVFRFLSFVLFNRRFRSRQSIECKFRFVFFYRAPLMFMHFLQKLERNEHEMSKSGLSIIGLKRQYKFIYLFSSTNSKIYYSASEVAGLLKVFWVFFCSFVRGCSIFLA